MREVQENQRNLYQLEWMAFLGYACVIPVLCRGEKGSVLDVEMTILDKHPEGISIDE